MIKNKSMKMLVAAMALSLVMAPVVGANARSVSGNTSAPDNSVSGNTSAPDNSGDEEGGSEEREREEEVAEIPSTSMIKFNGEFRTSTLKGAYMSETFQGTIVGTDKDVLAEAYGVGDSAQPYIKIYDITEKNTPAAMESIEAAAEAVGGSVIGAVNMEIGSLEEGKFTLFAQDGRKITMIFSIPVNQVKDGYTYEMVSVRPGGTVEILPDLDQDLNTVSFQTTGGLGAYAMIMHPAD